MNEVEKVVINSMGSNLPDFDFSEFMDLLSQIGITENEIANLENHFILNEEYFSSEEGMAIFEDVISRLEASLQRINEKTLADEDYIPSEAEITEFVSLYEELISAFKLKASISMVKDGVETKYSLVQLLKADLDLDAEYKIELYNEDSELLLDAVITAEFIKDNFGEIIDKVDDLTETVVKGNVKTTVKGAKLPKTASNNIPMALLGIVFTISGVVLLRKLRIKNGKGQGEQI
jgi:processed acidic surface protein